MSLLYSLYSDLVTFGPQFSDLMKQVAAIDKSLNFRIKVASVSRWPYHYAVTWLDSNFFNNFWCKIAKLYYQALYDIPYWCLILMVYFNSMGQIFVDAIHKNINMITSLAWYKIFCRLKIQTLGIFRLWPYIHKILNFSLSVDLINTQTLVSTSYKT